MDKAEELYGCVDRLLHQLTLQSNQRIQTLELIQTLEAQEGRLHQVGPVPFLRPDPLTPLPKLSSTFPACVPPD